MNTSAARTLVFGFDGIGNEPRDASGFKHDESVSDVLKPHVLMGGGLEEDRSETLTRGGGHVRRPATTTESERGSGDGEGCKAMPDAACRFRGTE